MSPLLVTIDLEVAGVEFEKVDEFVATVAEILRRDPTMSERIKFVGVADVVPFGAVTVAGES